MRAFGIILIVGGLAATIAFGIRAMENSESFEIFNLDIAISTANWMPVLVSLAFIIIGIIFTRVGKWKKFKEGRD
jgi:hypothetical protein